MLPSKTTNKSKVSDTPNSKGSPATPRVNRFGRTTSKSESDSRSPLQSSRLTVERSPKSVESKPINARRASNINSTTPDRPATSAKRPESREQLNAAREDLEKVKEKLEFLEKENARILQELKEANDRADEAREKLRETLALQKQAEEDSEIEKFRALELEQAELEVEQQKDEIWQKEIEGVRNQHAIDVAALLSTTQELQRVKQELAMSTEAKNAALSHAEDAMKIAEINAEKVEILSGEIVRLKALLESKLEEKNREAGEQVAKLNSEIDVLKSEVEIAKGVELKLAETENLVVVLEAEVVDAKSAEAYARNLVDEWKKKAGLLEAKMEEAVQTHRSTSESLALTENQLQESNAGLQAAVSDIACLKGKLESLEEEAAKHKRDLDESDQQLEMAVQEKLELERMMDVFKSELQIVEEEKIKAAEKEKKIVAELQNLIEDKEKILNELENSREEVEHIKKAMDGLASALHEVSAEARESKEQLLTKQAEVSDANDQINELEFSLRSTEENYESALDDLKDEIFRLKNAMEKSELESERLKSEWELKELNFINSLKQSEGEVSAVKAELNELLSKLKGAESDASAAKEEEILLTERVKEAALEAASANEAAEEAKMASSQLRERLLDKENELQNIAQENDDLRVREEAALEKIKELSRLLDEAATRKTDEHDELSSSEKDYETVEKATEVLSNGAAVHETAACKLRSPDAKLQEQTCFDSDTVIANGAANEKDRAGKVDSEKWESKLVDKSVSPDHEPGQDHLDDELDSKHETESLYQANGHGSPTVKEQQKKKKPILRMFGSLRKKNQK